MSSVIFLKLAVLQRIFRKGDPVVYCAPVGSHGEYCCRIFSVLLVIFLVLGCHGPNSGSTASSV